jgi:hypothetical protein
MVVFLFFNPIQQNFEQNDGLADDLYDESKRLE